MQNYSKLNTDDLDMVSGGGLTGFAGGHNFTITHNRKSGEFTIACTGGEEKVLSSDQFMSLLERHGSKMAATSLFNTAQTSSKVKSDDNQIIAGALRELF